MAQMPHYPADHFPADLAASLSAAVVTALLGGPAAWYLSLRYLAGRHPAHPELRPAAAVAGCVDGILLGLLALAATFALRLWLRERAERKRSDAALRLALEEMERPQNGRV